LHLAGSGAGGRFRGDERIPPQTIAQGFFCGSPAQTSVAGSRKAKAVGYGRGSKEKMLAVGGSGGPNRGGTGMQTGKDGRGA